MIDAAPNPKRSRGWLQIAGTLASLGLLAWMLSQQDWHAIQAFAAGIPEYLLLLALGLAFA